jgi:DNA-binding HxlR family transcriptional regulator
MATKRTYGDGCAIAHGLDLVGERWALLVVRELLLGPKRFTDLKRGLPNASACASSSMPACSGAASSPRRRARASTS